MSVIKQVETSQSKEMKSLELNARERLVLKMFRQLNEQGREDIIRFLNVLLKA